MTLEPDQIEAHEKLRIDWTNARPESIQTIDGVEAGKPTWVISTTRTCPNTRYYNYEDVNKMRRITRPDLFYDKPTRIYCWVRAVVKHEDEAFTSPWSPKGEFMLIPLAPPPDAGTLSISDFLSKECQVEVKGIPTRKYTIFLVPSCSTEPSE